MPEQLAALVTGRLDRRLECAINRETDEALTKAAWRLGTTRSGAARHLLAVGISMDAELTSMAIEAARLSRERDMQQQAKREE
jgi:hypothetical protein